MKMLLRNLKIPAQNEANMGVEVARVLGIGQTDFEICSIIRRSLDTRKRNQPYYVYSLELSFDCTVPVHKDLSKPVKKSPEHLPVFTSSQIPIVIGMGPAGLFAALELVDRGYKPLIFERGKSLEARAIDVQRFWNQGILNPESNVQFGEGGAGAFSDGKLTSRGQNPWIDRIYELLIKHGADPTISYEALPHCGTDGIRAVVSSIREYLLSQGAQIHYESKLNDVRVGQARIEQIKINDYWLESDAVIIALGNSARDSFEMLHKRGIALEAKAFAVGYRLEHPQDYLNKVVYGDARWAETLGAASYRLADGKVYTFCMCPGGEVIAAASEEGSLVTNGMSYSNREAYFGNSAVLATVDADLYGSKLFDGMNFQKMIERKTYRNRYYAPVQSCRGFMNSTVDKQCPKTSFKPGVESGDISTLYPPQIVKLIKKSLHKFDSIYSDFTKDAVLIASETRSSSPIRILRDPLYRNSLGLSNLFPVGEGSGYAGGIISSAADGLKTASRFQIR